jgi:hypothetical protein
MVDPVPINANALAAQLVRDLPAELVRNGPLTEQDWVNLRWVKRVNDPPQSIGLYGSSVRREGPLPFMARLIDAGLCELREAETVPKSGYWITESGRAALGEK